MVPSPFRVVVMKQTKTNMQLSSLICMYVCIMLIDSELDQTLGRSISEANLNLIGYHKNANQASIID